MLKRRPRKPENIQSATFPFSPTFIPKALYIALSFKSFSSALWEWLYRKKKKKKNLTNNSLLARVMSNAALIFGSDIYALMPVIRV